MLRPHVHPVQIYYEDTDHSGVVYHANYLKYFERAREHLLGVSELVALYREDGIGFVVYKAELVYKEGASFGESLEIHTLVSKESEYRLRFQQDVVRAGQTQKLVEGKVELVCVDAEKRLVPLPKRVLEGLST